MDLDDHARHLGGLIGNFQSLEFLLRIFLSKMPGARPCSAPYGAIYLSPVGTELPENDITSYDTLGQLIAKFNSEADRQRCTRIDDGLVAIRDALAHGRVSASEVDEHLRLLKFNKPQNGKVRVVFNEELSEDWFTNQKRRVREAMDIVYNLINH
jgi:hypothetical protein